MAILQVGLPKSGNFWSYRLLENIINHAGIEQKSFIKKQLIYETAKQWELSYAGQAGIDVLDIDTSGCFYRISSVFREPIENLDNYVYQNSLVWTHSAFCRQSFTVLPKFDKIIYVVRDPRDVALSMAKFAFTPYFLKYYPHHEISPDRFLASRYDGILRNWVKHVGGYLKYAHNFKIHFVFYERLLSAFDDELADLLEYLDINLSAKSLADIKNEVHFSNMKKKDPHHVRKGEVGKWINILTDSQKKQANLIAGQMLELLNYPVSDSKTSLLPSVPAESQKHQIENAIEQSQRTRLEMIKQLYQLLRSRRPLYQKIERLRLFISRNVKELGFKS